MTNITLSIEDSVYKKMKRHSEIRWSEFVRRSIKEYIDRLDQLKERPNQELKEVMLASQELLKKDWDNEYDERWNNV